MLLLLKIKVRQRSAVYESDLTFSRCTMATIYLQYMYYMHVIKSIHTAVWLLPMDERIKIRESAGYVPCINSRILSKSVGHRAGWCSVYASRKAASKAVHDAGAIASRPIRNDTIWAHSKLSCRPTLKKNVRRSAFNWYTNNSAIIGMAGMDWLLSEDSVGN